MQLWGAMLNNNCGWAAYWLLNPTIQPLHQMIDSIRATNPAAVPRIANWWLNCALAERDATAAKDALVAARENAINLGNDVFVIVHL